MAQEDEFTTLLRKAAMCLKESDRRNKGLVVQGITYLVYKEVLSRRGRFPTAGEFLTGFARRDAQLAKLQNELRASSARIYAHEYAALLTRHWSVRRSKISEQHQPLVDEVCELTEEMILNREGPYTGRLPPENRLILALTSSQDAGDQQEGTLWQTTHFNWVKNVLSQKTVEAFESVIAAQELPMWIKEPVQDAYEYAKDNRSTRAVDSVVVELRTGIRKAIAALKLPTKKLEVIRAHREPIEFNEAVQLFVKDPGAEIRTLREAQVASQLDLFNRWRDGKLSPGEQNMDDRTSPYILTGDVPVTTVFNEEWGMEPILRLFEAIGVRAQEAERVVLRGGTSGYPAMYYVYPIEQEYCVLVAIHVSYTLDFVCGVRGGLQQALAWLKDRSPIGERPENITSKNWVETFQFVAKEDAPRNVFAKIDKEEHFAAYLALRREASEHSKRLKA